MNFTEILFSFTFSVMMSHLVSLFKPYVIELTLHSWKDENTTNDYTKLLLKPSKLVAILLSTRTHVWHQNHHLVKALLPVLGSFLQYVYIIFIYAFILIWGEKERERERKRERETLEIFLYLSGWIWPYQKGHGGNLNKPFWFFDIFFKGAV